MYATDWVKPNEEAYVAERLLDESGQLPVTQQKTNNTQQRILTIVCASSADVVAALRMLQDDERWCTNIENNMQPVKDGLNLFRGTIRAVRYLKTTERDDGYYKTGITSF